MTPALYFAKAERALTSARLLLQDGDIEGACGCYVQVASPWERRAPARQTGNRGQAGAWRSQERRSQVERLRLLADYTGEPIDPGKAAWVVDQATAFVEAMWQGRANVREE